MCREKGLYRQERLQKVIFKLCKILSMGKHIGLPILFIDIKEDVREI